MDREILEEKMLELPLMGYYFLDPQDLEFTHRVRHICRQECPMYGKTWACPPAVGSVESCREKCRSYVNCLMISTAAQVSNIGNMEEGLATRGPHEEVTNQVRDLLRQLGAEPYVLSTQACALCDRCAYLEGEPCRYPEKMHPCVESHGINLVPTLEALGLDFLGGRQIITWFSLLFY